MPAPPPLRPRLRPCKLVGLHKRFGETIAVDGVDLNVPQGSLFGLVGPNGAGKTTSLSMAVGCCARMAAARGPSALTSGPTRSAPSSSSEYCRTTWPCRSGYYSSAGCDSSPSCKPRASRSALSPA